MSDTSEKRTLTPHLVIIGVIAIVILAVLLWPSKEPEPVIATPEPAIEAEPAVAEEPERFEPAPTPEPVEIDPYAEVEPLPTTPEPEPEPVDISDQAIHDSLQNLSESPQMDRLLATDALLERFVVSVTNLANDEMAPGHRLFKAPEQSFRVYSQADKEWIDAASYKRYSPYVDLFESFDNQALMSLFEKYENDMQSNYAEIGDPDKAFSEVVVEAIDQLLDTPEVPFPVEVYTDSVAYKYADPRLEKLSAPQKQLLRTGPDNMRRIKAKLREVKALLQERGSD
ncbi:DUF3014 domain-containing protein [Alteromonas aestuariivivens]|uniref:DUF3014 domain-containing protein n=1 Tax=Alteromonas aestuariivivens TaxID=1938339 RepID=A0A3D8M4Z9_9ALTE|nr:DUF3014 domain-containing protein [Alteromonas aestuariivivens]RDV24817.1 DUF3014 domain-containing protein [Alteromonas aestuariivivens]